MKHHRLSLVLSSLVSIPIALLLGSATRGLAQSPPPQSETNPAAAAANDPNQSLDITPPIFIIPILRRASGVPEIGVSFNQKPEIYRLLIDTAASVTVITKPMADEVGWEETGTIEASLSSGEKITVPIGIVQSIYVGGIRINNFVVAVGAVPLLGQNFHGRFRMLINRTEVLLQALPEDSMPETPSL